MITTLDVDDVSAAVIDSTYNDVVNVLNYYADCYVPKRSSSFYKFWWDEELDLLKSNAIQSCALWRSPGRSHSGSLCNKYRTDKQAYKRAVNDDKHNESLMYNDLHDLMLEKQGSNFRRVWRSKVGSSCSEIMHVDGVSDDKIIAPVDKFVKHSQNTCKPADSDSCERLRDEYNAMRSDYCGDHYLSDQTFDDGLVERIIK